MPHLMKVSCESLCGKLTATQHIQHSGWPREEGQTTKRKTDMQRTRDFIVNCKLRYDKRLFNAEELKSVQ